jgi:hypothetical protein
MLTRVLPPREAYRSIDLSIIFIPAGPGWAPRGKTGITTLVAQNWGT